MKEMKEDYKQEKKKEEDRYQITSHSYFSFVVKPARIITEEETKQKSQKDQGIKLFDFGERDEIKESFAANTEKDDPLDGPKLYLNVVHHERVLPPLSKDKDIADENDDSSWQVIPIAFSMPVKRRNV